MKPSVAFKSGAAINRDRGTAVSINQLLGATEGGRFHANAAQAAGVSETLARAASVKMAPAIAKQLKDHASRDPDAFDRLLDLIEEGDASELAHEGALTDADAQNDGAEILAEIYGSAQGAEASLCGLAGKVGKAGCFTLACINATAVLAALSAVNAPKLAQSAAQAGGSGGGFLSILLSALVKGLLQGAARQLAPRRRRRRYSSLARRRRVTRRRKRSIGIDDVFREILTGGR
jgi:hypothetical protein